MIILISISFFLLVVGSFIILDLSPIVFLEGIAKYFKPKKLSIKDKIASIKKTKPPKGIKLLLLEVKEILRITGKSGTFATVSVLAVILFVIGIFMPDELKEVENMQYDYGYNQTLAIYEKDYMNGSGRSYEGIVFSDGIKDVVYYNQLDERWATLSYGQSSTIGEAGCGPTAMSIVISTLLGEVHDPVELCQWSETNGYLSEGNGSYHALIPAAAKEYGLSVEGNLGEKDIVDALSSGKLVVAIMSKGHFTTGGHFIVLRGVTDDGKILVADPVSYSRSEKEWNLQIILDESNKAYVAGGPYWAFDL